MNDSLLLICDVIASKVALAGSLDKLTVIPVDHFAAAGSSLDCQSNTSQIRVDHFAETGYSLDCQSNTSQFTEQRTSDTILYKFQEIRQ